MTDIDQALDQLQAQLDWRGPNGRQQGHIVISRDHAQVLLDNCPREIDPVHDSWDAQSLAVLIVWTMLMVCALVAFSWMYAHLVHDVWERYSSGVIVVGIIGYGIFLCVFAGLAAGYIRWWRERHG